MSSPFPEYLYCPANLPLQVRLYFWKQPNVTNKVDDLVKQQISFAKNCEPVSFQWTVLLSWWRKKVSSVRSDVLNTHVNVTLSIFLHNKLGWLTMHTQDPIHILQFHQVCMVLRTTFSNIFHILLTHYEPFMPLKKTGFLHSFCVTCFRQHCTFKLHSFTISQRALMLLLCSKFLLPIFQDEIWTHISYTYYSFDKTGTFRNCSLYRLKPAHALFWHNKSQM